MQFLLVLLLGVAQSDGAENFSQTVRDFAQEAAPPQAVAPDDGLQQLIPNQVQPIPETDHRTDGGALYPDQPEVFMPPNATASDPLQNFRPHHGSQFAPHHGRPDFHHGGQPPQGIMPGGNDCPSCRAEPQFVGGDSFSFGASCPSCQTCPTACPSSCQPYFGCPSCRSCCSLFGCWHLCNCCDPCTRKRLQAQYCGTPGDMYPESPYFPVNHGNYYFRPYTWSHVGIQQQIAARWGADPRAPYQSQLFCYLYEEMGIPYPYPESDDQPGHIPGQESRPSDHFTSVP